MTARITVRDGSGPREVQNPVFPIPLGGAGPGAIPLPGWANTMPAAWLHPGETGLSMEASAPDVPLSINRRRVPGRVALVDGDRVRLGEAEIRVHQRDGEVSLEVAGSSGAAPVPSVPPAPLEAAPTFASVAPPPRVRPGGRRRVVTGVLLLVLLLLAGAAAAVVLLGRRVAIPITPAPSFFELTGGWIRPRTGDSWLLLKGRYHVRATLDGHHPLDETIEVGDAASQVFPFELRRLPGRMNLQVHRNGRPDTEVAAEITLNGKPIGTAPLRDHAVEHGPRVLVLSAPRYEGLTTNVVVEGLGRPFSLDFPLKPLWADVKVETDPAGATLSVDGEERGVAPAELEIAEGRRTLLARLPLHVPVQTTVVFRADSRVELPVLRLLLSPGILELVTEPAGASVAINGEYAGQTPLTAPLPARKPLSVKISRNGYQDATVELTLEPEQTAKQKIVLRPTLGEIRLTVNPPDAEVRVNGTVWAGGQPMRLPADAVRIEASREGYEPWSRVVTPRPGFPIELTAMLVPKRTVSGGPAAVAEKDSITRQLGLVMATPKPGAFAMGSSRREQGRRSHEGLRQVELRRAFAISTTEITNDAFRKFRAGHNSGAFKGATLNDPAQPVVNVSWQDAAAFCNWMSAQDGLPPAYVAKNGLLGAADPMTPGYRLPTEAEWEFCARMGRADGLFPWNGGYPPPAKAGNFADTTARGNLGYAIENYSDGAATTAAPGRFDVSPAGLHDLAGNVAEWCHDFFGASPTALPGTPPDGDPNGPATGTHRVIRGSSWRTMLLGELRTAARDYGDKARDDVGFRVARTLEGARP